MISVNSEAKWPTNKGASKSNFRRNNEKDQKKRRAIISLKMRYHNRPLKIELLQFYDGLWIHNLKKQCSAKC